MKIENLEKAVYLHTELKRLQDILISTQKSNKIGIIVFAFPRTSKNNEYQFILNTKESINNCPESCESLIYNNVSHAVVKAITDTITLYQQELYKLGIENF